MYIYLYLYLYDENCCCKYLWESTNIGIIVPQKKWSSPTFVGTASNSSSGTLSRHSLTAKTSPVWIFWLRRPRENAKNLVVYEWPDPFPRFGDRFLISVFYRTYWPIGPFTAIAFGHNLEIAQNRWLNEWTTKKTQIWDPQSGVWLETFCAIVDGISVPHSVALPTAGSVWSH